MRKIIALSFLILFGLCQAAHATGTLSVTKATSFMHGKQAITLTWLTDGSGNMPANYTIHVSTIAAGESFPFMGEILGSYLYEADVVPNGTYPPTGAYTITLTRATNGAAMDEKALTSVAVGTSGPIYFPGFPVVDGDITVAFSGSPGNSKGSTITLYFVVGTAQ
jgi:hypothetical protein